MRPTWPSVVVRSPLVEGPVVATLATCSSSDFRPGNITVSWLLQGEIVEIMPDTVVLPIAGEKFRVTSQYKRAVSRTENGKTLTCTVNHETLDVAGRSKAVILDVACK